jgi:hypothetical protein
MRPTDRIATSAPTLGLAIAFSAPVSGAGARSPLTNVQPLPYRCSDDGTGAPLCVYKGVQDCNEMRKDGVCGLPTPDLECYGEPGHEACFCDWVGSSLSRTNSFITKQIVEPTPIRKTRKVRRAR